MRIRATARPDSGFSLLDLMVGMTLLLVGLCGFLQSTVSTMDLSATTRERGTAAAAIRGMLEQLAAEDYATLFVRYNAYPKDDPGGVGSAPGASFPVEGLEPVEGDPDGEVGEIVFPTRTPTGRYLTESPPDDFPGMPLDLNLDGDTVDTDVGGDHDLLPVIVRLRWRSSTGKAHLAEARTLLVQR